MGGNSPPKFLRIVKILYKAAAEPKDQVIHIHEAPVD